MKPKIVLRTASALMFLHAVGHTIGTLSWKNTNDPVKREVINQMTEHKFPFMGANRSMGDTFDGYGFAMILALLLMAIIFWLVSDVQQQNTSIVRKIIFSLSIILLAWGIDELIFFFLFAASFSLSAGALGLYCLALLNTKAYK